MTFVSTNPEPKPELDENSFQQLLAAAYVVQEHNASLRAVAPGKQPEQKLLEVAEVQAAIRGGGFDISGSAQLISDRLSKLAGATGVSVSLISNGFLDCVAESGLPARIPGSSVASHSLVATERLKACGIFEATNALTDIRLDIELCKSLRVESLLAVPVLCFGQLAGLIELRWDRECAFQTRDVAICRLMAELITEILERKSERPQHPAAAKTQAAAPTAADPSSAAAKEAQSLSPTTLPAETAMVHPGERGTERSNEHVAATPQGAPSCRVCGRAFGADEAFCGFCSMPRFAAAPSKGLQSKWASLWYIQQAQDTLEDQVSTEPAPAPMPPSVEAQQVAEPIRPAAPVTDAVHEQPTPPTERSDAIGHFKPDVQTYTDPDRDDIFATPLWSRFETFLSKIRLKDALLLGLAAALAFGVASAWPSSDGHLTWFQATMVRFGIYHSAARSPVYGNPDLNVWVDARTALYYCPGSEQYGKTLEGHYTTQREALQAHSQPASGLACQ